MTAYSLFLAYELSSVCLKLPCVLCVRIKISEWNREMLGEARPDAFCPPDALRSERAWCVCRRLEVSELYTKLALQ